MKRIMTASSVAGVALMIGVALGVMNVKTNARLGVGPAGTDPTTLVMLLLFVCWVILSLMIGQAMPVRRRAVTISGMVRAVAASASRRAGRVTVTDELKTKIVAAYIGDGRPSIREVSALTKCSYGTVHRVLREAGVLRPRGLTKRAATRKAATA